MRSRFQLKSVSVQFVLTPEQTARETEREQREASRARTRAAEAELEAAIPSLCQSIVRPGSVDIRRLREAILAAEAADADTEVIDHAKGIANWISGFSAQG